MMEFKPPVTELVASKGEQAETPRGMAGSGSGSGSVLACIGHRDGPAAGHDETRRDETGRDETRRDEAGRDAPRSGTPPGDTTARGARLHRGATRVAASHVALGHGAKARLGSRLRASLGALAVAAAAALPTPGLAQDAAELLERLRAAQDATEARRLENQVLEAWSRSGSASMDLLLRRGQDALEREDWAIAARHFRALTDHAPGFAEGWHGLALAYYNTERLGPAMDALERVLALNPDHFAALRGVAAIHQQVDRPALAYRAFEKVLSLRPHDAEVERALDRLEREVKGTAL